MVDEVAELKKRVQELEKAQNELLRQMLSQQQELVKAVVKQTIDELKAKEDPLKQEVLRKVNKNKKRLMKRKILNLAAKQIELPELKYAVVDQLRFCSKASFYRYIEELKKTGALEFLTVNNKQFVAAQPELEKTADAREYN